MLIISKVQAICQSSIIQFSLKNYLSKISFRFLTGQIVNSNKTDHLYSELGLIAMQLMLFTSMKQKCHHDDSPDSHWRRYRQTSTSPANTKAVNLMTFPFLCMLQYSLIYAQYSPTRLCFVLFRAILISVSIMIYLPIFLRTDVAL